MKKYIYSFFILIGCSNEKPITGEVFILTQNGNIKLGLVRINLVEEKTFNEFLSQKIRIANDSLGLVYHPYNQIMDSIKTLDEIEKELELKESYLSYDDYDSRLHILKKRQKISDQSYKLALKLMDYSSTYHKYISSEFYFTDLPKPIDSTRTDSNGEFRLHFDERRNYFLVAYGLRIVGDRTENYYWIIKHPMENLKENEKLILSNDNLFEPLSLLDVKNFPHGIITSNQ
jgi:hypothetical protein